MPNDRGVALDVYWFRCSRCGREDLRVYPEGGWMGPLFTGACVHCGYNARMERQQGEGEKEDAQGIVFLCVV